MPSQIKIKVRHCLVRCAYCHDLVAGGQTCALCRTRIHTDCLYLAGVCPTLGCEGLRDRRPQASEVLSVPPAPGAEGCFSRIALWFALFLVYCIFQLGMRGAANEPPPRAPRAVDYEAIHRVQRAQPNVESPEYQAILEEVREAMERERDERESQAR